MISSCSIQKCLRFFENAFYLNEMNVYHPLQSASIHFIHASIWCVQKRIDGGWGWYFFLLQFTFENDVMQTFSQSTECRSTLYKISIFRKSSFFFLSDHYFSVIASVDCYCIVGMKFMLIRLLVHSHSKHFSNTYTF